MSVYKSMLGKRTFQQSLGISQDEPFDPTKHEICRKIKDGADGQYEARNCFVSLRSEVSSHIIQTILCTES